MLRKRGPRKSLARACIFTTSSPVAPCRTPGTSPRRYIGASWWISDRGTNSVKPPVSFWIRRRRSMWRIQCAGCSTWPYMMVEVVRMPWAWAEVITSIHCSTVIRPRAIRSRMSWSSTSAEVPGSVPSARLLELGEVLRDGQPGAGRAVEDLLRGEGVQVHLGQGGLDGAAEIDVVAAVELRGQAGLDADLGRAELPRLDGAANHLVHREEVALLLAMVAAERAEAAMLDADVGEVDVAVHDVGDHVARLAAAHLVRDEGDGLEVAPGGLGQPDAVVHRQLPSVEETAEDAAHVGGGPVERDRDRVVGRHHQFLHTSRSGLTKPSESTRPATRPRRRGSRKSLRVVYSG